MLSQKIEMKNEDFSKQAFYHMLKELEIPNIWISIETSEFENLKRAHDSIHELVFLAPLCIPHEQKVNWESKSAFLMFHWEAFHSAHRSFIETLSGYYNAGYVLLRTTLELLIKGAFWECLAHKDFRENAEIICKNAVGIGKSKKTLIDWFGDVIKHNPTIEMELERTSGGIFDIIEPIPEDPVLRRFIPPQKVVIEQLDEWGIFGSIRDPTSKVYSIYSSLSGDVHVIPDETDIGRRLLQEKDIFEITVIYEELNKFLEILRKVIDIGIVIELNILSDWINWSEKVKLRLKERLPIVKSLDLNYARLEIEKLIGHKLN